MLWNSLFTALCSFTVATTSSHLDQHWESWKKTHDKSYAHQVEEMGRRRLWEQNLEMITVHNLEASLGLHTYELAMNHLGDSTFEEITSSLAGTVVPSESERIPYEFLRVNKSSPASSDLRDHGSVTSVKSQGHCGSCWAFSAVGASEGQLKKTTGILMSLSPQNLIDCSSKYGNYGCRGGFMANAFQYVLHNQGIDSDAAYPYIGKRGQCKYDPTYRAANCSGYGFSPKGDEFALTLASANIGPISVAIDASQPKFLFYRHGVYKDHTCSHNVNHGVSAVGYGTEKGEDYWSIKNSWGDHYGDKGYVKSARNRNNQCGVASYACFPIM